MKNLLQTLLLITTLSACSIINNDPKDELPPETQTGANTFGCLINGEIFIPKGNDGTPNLDLYYLPDHDAGYFNLASYYINGGVERSIIIIFDSISRVGINVISPNRWAVVSYFEYKNGGGCDYTDDEITSVVGELEIKKLDLNKKIIAGTFHFLLHNEDCDTLKIENGRFDLKI